MHWFNNARGEILAADGTVLANLAPTPAADKKDYPYHYIRQYPQGALYGGITGYDSALTGAVTDIENEYNSDLERTPKGAPRRSVNCCSGKSFRHDLTT